MASAWVLVMDVVWFQSRYACTHAALLKAVVWESLGLVSQKNLCSLKTPLEVGALKVSLCRFQNVLASDNMLLHVYRCFPVISWNTLCAERKKVQVVLLICRCMHIAFLISIYLFPCEMVVTWLHTTSNCNYSVTSNYGYSNIQILNVGEAVKMTGWWMEDV